MTELNYGDIAAGLSSIASGFKLLSSAFANAAAGVPAVACKEVAEEAQKLAETVEAPSEEKKEEPAPVKEEKKADPTETFAKIRKIFAVALKKDKKMAKAVLTRFGASITEVETNSPEKADALYDELVAAFGDEANA